MTKLAIVIVALGAPLARAQSSAPDIAPSTTRTKPANATQALDQSAAAYEYGDMNLVVETARMIADGALPADEAQKADAFRFLGIGLYLTGRIEGARVAFENLLALRPDAQLDPTLTRPEIVAFFKAIKRQNDQRRQAQQQANLPSRGWAFLPPFGQFKNGDNTKGWIILGAGVGFAAASITMERVLTGWQNPDDGTFCGPAERSCSRTNTAKTMKSLTYVGTGLVLATYLYGVIDALVRHGHNSSDVAAAKDDGDAHFGLAIYPGGAGLLGSF